MSDEEAVKPNEYPKWVDHPTIDRGTAKDGKRIPERVLVKDAKEEAEVTGKSTKKGKAAGWADPAANPVNPTGQAN